MASAGGLTGSDVPDNPDKNQDRRNRVVLGNLPDDFLRPDSLAVSGHSSTQQEMADRELAIQLQEQQWVGNHQTTFQQYAGQLIITVVEASLVKNYGMTRMDPYARLRVGHAIYETHAVSSGGRTPRWNKRIQCYLPVGVKTISLEIYDECALSMDELIAYGQITIPDIVFRRESIDEWFQLSGKQGENKEGSIHLILTLMPITAPQFTASPMGLAMSPTYAGYPISGASVVPVGPVATPMMMMPTYGLPAYSPMAVYSTTTAAPGIVPPPGPPTTAAVPRPKLLTEEEIKEIESMFPSLDKQVIQSVIDACGGRRELVIDSLLQISDQ